MLSDFFWNEQLKLMIFIAATKTKSKFEAKKQKTPPKDWDPYQKTL